MKKNYGIYLLIGGILFVVVFLIIHLSVASKDHHDMMENYLNDTSMKVNIE